MKDKYENIKVGDCFVLKINSRRYPNYKNKFLVLIVDDKFIDSQKRKNIIISVKITDIIIKIINVNNFFVHSEYICTKITWLEERYFPFDGSKTAKEHIDFINSKPIIANELGMLYEYEYRIIVDSKNENLFKHLEYIGNREEELPINCYKPINFATMPFSFLDDLSIVDFEKLMIKNYEEFNLKKSPFFDKENSIQSRKFWLDLLKAMSLAEETFNEYKKANREL